MSSTVWVFGVGGHRFGAGLKPPQEGVTFLLYRFPFSFGVLDTGRFLNGVLTALLLVCTRGLVARARPVGHRASQGAVAPELIHLCENI